MFGNLVLLWTVLLAFSKTCVYGLEGVKSVNVTDLLNVTECGRVQKHLKNDLLFYIDNDVLIQHNAFNSSETTTLLSGVNDFYLVSDSTIFYSDKVNKVVSLYDIQAKTPTYSPVPYPAGAISLASISGDEAGNFYLALFYYGNQYSYSAYKVDGGNFVKLFDNPSRAPNNPISFVSTEFFYCTSGAVMHASINSANYFPSIVFGSLTNVGGKDGDQGVGQISRDCMVALQDPTTMTQEWIYVTSTNDHTIRLVNTKASPKFVTTIAGSRGVSGDAVGNGIEALFNRPQSISVLDITPSRHHAYVCDAGNKKIKKIDIRFQSPCNSQIAVVLDRTYRKNTKFAMAQVRDFVREFSSQIVFRGSKVSLTNLRPHSIQQIIGLNDPEASQKSEWYAKFASQKGGWKNRATQFWNVFTDIADSVTQAGKDNFIILVTDGQLRDSWRSWQHVAKMEAMKAKWGADAPTLICILVGDALPSQFLKDICKSSIYPIQVAQDLGAAMCV